MELWIRTQDRMRLIKPNKLGIKYVGKNFDDDWIIYESQNSMRYGIYHSKERALEVLDEIHQRLIDLQTLEITKDNRFTIRNLDCVYEMPKE